MTERTRIAAGTVGLIGAALIAFNAHFEGTRYTPYQDAAGITTVCRGHTGGVFSLKRYSAEECAALQLGDLQQAANQVARCVKVDLWPEQFDALVDFQFNTGAPCTTTLYRKLNAGDCQGAADQFPRWVYADGKPLPGLVRRRAAERQLFLKGCR